MPDVPRLRAFLLLLAIAAPAAFCPYASTAQVRTGAPFSHLTTADGLSQSGINSILQDRQGFMWFGTSDGLNRYDGYHFRIYRHDPEDANSPSGNSVHALLEDRRGRIWMSVHGGGVDRLDPETDTFTHFRHDPNDPNSLSGNIVNSILEDRQGRIWIGTQRDGLNLLDPETGRVTRYPVEPDGATNFMMSLAEDSAGDLWIAAVVLLRLDVRTGRLSRHRPDVIHGIRAILEDEAGFLWIGSTQGLARFDPATDAVRLFPPVPDAGSDASANNVDSILRDASGKLWIGTPSGLYVFDREKGAFEEHFDHDASDPRSLTSDWAAELYQDDAGLLWIGTGDAGLNILDARRRQFTNLRHDASDPNSLPDRHVRALWGDPSGVLWMGSSHGTLSRLDRTTGRMTHYRHDPARPGSMAEGSIITAIRRGPEGALWVGGWNTGLNRLDEKTGQFTTFRHDPADPTSISSDNILALHHDRSGTLWIGTIYGGLSRLEPGKARFETFRHDASDPFSLGDDAVSAIEEDRQGRLWFGTWGGVLSLYDAASGRFRNYGGTADGPDASPSGSIYSIHQDRQGNLWLATSGGLDLFDAASGSFQHFGRRDGLAGSNVQSIAEDARGRLWLGTKSGLSEFDPAARQFRTFTVSDGLPTDEFHDGAAFRSADGEIFFGTTSGLVSFRPEAITGNPAVPSVVLTDIRVLNEPLEAGAGGRLRKAAWAADSLVLTHADRVFSIEFAALSYGAPAENLYRYRLEGLEDAWNEVGSDRRVAMYSNLNPGTYTFRVIGSNDDGVWNEVGAALTLVVRPPWWASWWFRLLALSAVAALVYAAVSMRVRLVEGQRERLAGEVDLRTRELHESNRRLAAARDAAEEASRARGDFVAGMSHELRTPLNAVLGFAELMRRDRSLPERHLEYLDYIHGSGEYLLGLINDVLDLAKIDAGRMTLDTGTFDLPLLLRSLEQTFTAAADGKGLRLSFEFPPDLPRLVVGDQGKLRQVGLNLLSNAIKFTEQGLVRVRSRYSDETLFVEVEDTGAGITEDERDLVFEAFMQTDAGRRKQSGTGLGLAITARLLALMSGGIQFRSVPGAGSTFSFHLPLPLAGSGTDVRERERRVVGLAGGVPAPRVLVVDDQEANRRLLADMLLDAGFSVREASGGHDAVRLAKGWDPAFIWMDTRMPDLSGTEAARAIRRERPEQRPVIAALSAGSEASGDDVFDACLPKPFRAANVFALMAEALGLRYLYDTDGAAGGDCGSDALSPTLLRPLPEPLRAELHAAALRGRIDRIPEILEAVMQVDRGLGERLTEAVNGFRLDEVVAALDALQPTGEPEASA